MSVLGTSLERVSTHLSVQRPSPGSVCFDSCHLTDQWKSVERPCASPEVVIHVGRTMLPGPAGVVLSELPAPGPFILLSLSLVSRAIFTRTSSPSYNSLRHGKQRASYRPPQASPASPVQVKNVWQMLASSPDTIMAPRQASSTTPSTSRAPEEQAPSLDERRRQKANFVAF
ncbi:hypothetical protein MAPG_09066 [Magnaporthiopsis poae ATCC 64411]|uniref:Uncharacterized protein n=1 Tax=Magnaporthiopsis poae (strain ATCC 64411 / 73-15) TaxID=644358 RepID=A0A0C4E8Z3_MAGP6|nr:hypothetical protein MAPG_09066 [Magnaporthiopsis poae ATCC 64411]